VPGELSAVAVLLLALLHEQPMHPYQLHQTLDERHAARLVRLNAGAVYHGIERLERDGLVEVVGTDREGRRPERTTYRITDAGRAAFASRVTSLVGDDHPAYPLFTVGLSEANELPAEVVVAQLTRRLERERRRLAELAEGRARLDARGLPRRFRIDLEYDEERLRHETAWLERTIDELTTGTLEWAEPLPSERPARRHAAAATPSPATR
jgi:DNA-binding PadR family transcriptional regulator